MDSADKWISPFAFKLRVPIDNKSNIPPLAFNCSYASSVINKNAEYTYNLRNPLTFADSAYKFCGFHLNLRIWLTFCGIYLQLRNPEQLAIFACCGIRNKTNVPTKFTLQVYACGIKEILFVESTYILEHILRLVSEIQEHADTKLCSYPVHSLAS